MEGVLMSEKKRKTAAEMVSEARQRVENLTAEQVAAELGSEDGVVLVALREDGELSDRRPTPPTMRRANMAEQAKITVLNNGPYLVKGKFLITDAAGNEYPAGRRTVALCRCGGSQNKPFCDGAHAKVGFQAAERASGAVAPRGAWLWRFC